MWGIGIDEIENKNWKYGFEFIGQYVSEKTINYVVKYMLKKDKDHKEYNPKILCSAGIGAGYLNRKDSKLNKFKGTDTNETYRLRNGTKLNLPIYYRNKVYTDNMYRDWETDRKSTRLNSSHITRSRMPSSA